MGKRAPLLIVLGSAGVGLLAGRIGILSLINREIFTATGTGSLGMSAMFLPVPIVSAFFIFRPMSRVERHFYLSFIGMGSLFCLPFSGLLHLSAFVAVVTWFGIAAQGVVGGWEKEDIRLVISVMTASPVIAELLIAVFGEGRGEIFCMFALFTFSIALLLLSPVNGKGNPHLSEKGRNGWISLPPSGTIVITLLCFSGGMAESILIARIPEWGMEVRAYAWMLAAHSLVIIMSLLVPPFRWQNVVCTVLWYLFLAGLWFLPSAYAALSYMGMGAAGTILMREFRVSYLSVSSAPASSAAMVYLLFSLAMAFGAVTGGWLF